MKRREFMALLGGTVAAWPLAASAQQRERVRRIGVLWPGSPPDKWDEAFRQGLRTLGYVEGRNILLEYRWAEGNQERLPILAEELARLPLDVIVTTPPARTADEIRDDRQFKDRESDRHRGADVAALARRRGDRMRREREGPR